MELDQKRARGPLRRDDCDADDAAAEEGIAQRLDARHEPHPHRTSRVSPAARSRCASFPRARIRRRPSRGRSRCRRARAIEAMPAGCIAIVDARGVTDAGIFGDILCARMRQRGVAALITDGVVRDVHGVLGTRLADLVLGSRRAAVGRGSDVRQLAGADRLWRRGRVSRRRHRRRRRRRRRHSRRARRRNRSRSRSSRKRSRRGSCRKSLAAFRFRDSIRRTRIRRRATPLIVPRTTRPTSEVSDETTHARPHGLRGCAARFRRQRLRLDRRRADVVSRCSTRSSTPAAI